MDDKEKYEYKVLISDEDILQEGSNFISLNVNKEEKTILEKIALRHKYDILIRN